MDLIFREKRRWRRSWIILEEDIPQFLVKLGQAVESEELDFSQWNLKHPEGIKEIAKEYIK